MALDQVELLTQERQTAPAAPSITSEVSAERASFVLDTVTKEHDHLRVEGESQGFDTFLKGLAWSAFAIALVSAGVLLWHAGASIVTSWPH